MGMQMCVCVCFIDNSPPPPLQCRSTVPNASASPLLERRRGYRMEDVFLQEEGGEYSTSSAIIETELCPSAQPHLSPLSSIRRGAASPLPLFLRGDERSYGGGGFLWPEAEIPVRAEETTLPPSLVYLTESSRGGTSRAKRFIVEASIQRFFFSPKSLFHFTSARPCIFVNSSRRRSSFEGMQRLHRG